MVTVIKKLPKEKAKILIKDYENEISRLDNLPSCGTSGHQEHIEARSQIRCLRQSVKLLKDGYERKECYICDDCNSLIEEDYYGLSITKNGHYTNLNLPFSCDLTLCKKCLKLRTKEWDKEDKEKT
jgi:hypothetical protein